MTYRGGALIIGSLLWDRAPGRVRWRREHLDDAREHVRAPILYGRRSPNRNNTPTMVLAPSSHAEPWADGTAPVVGLRNRSVEFDGVWAEACALWHAESNGAALPTRVGAAWGTVGLLCREPTPDLEDRWKREAGRGLRVPAQRSHMPLTDSALLDMAWPTRRSDGKPVDFDYLLAAVNVPESLSPSAEDLAEAWALQGCMEYFYENHAAGIRTATDDRIRSFLQQRRRVSGELAGE